MSEYCAPTGYIGTNYDQSLIWHYKTDISRNILNRWFVNIFDQGVLKYTPSAAGGANVTISAGTSFLIKEKTAVSPDVKIAKVDMILDYSMSVAAGYADDTYALIAMWENAAEEYRGVEYYLKNAADLATIVGLGYNYVQFGTVVVATGLVSTNTIVGITYAGMSSGLLGYSGFSGVGSSGFSGTSGWSGVSGFSGEAQITTSGYSGFSGFSAATPGDSGVSGFSGYSSTVAGVAGTSGYSGKSGFSGLTGSECILLTCSDEVTPLTAGLKVTFKMPYAMTITKVKATLTTAGTTSTIVDIREAGVSIFSSLPTLTTGIDSTTVAPGTGLSDTSLADDAKITVYINTAGTTATGLKVYIIGNKS
jgi:hypothetical protein